MTAIYSPANLLGANRNLLKKHGQHCDKDRESLLSSLIMMATDVKSKMSLESFLRSSLIQLFVKSCLSLVVGLQKTQKRNTGYALSKQLLQLSADPSFNPELKLSDLLITLMPTLSTSQTHHGLDLPICFSLNQHILWVSSPTTLPMFPHLFHG